MVTFIVRSLSEAQRRKIHKDLEFIDHITKAAKHAQCRVIISGGYAVDGNLGIITRPHNDIDVQIYSKNDDAKKTITSFLQNSEFKASVQDKGREEYYHAFRVEKDDFIVDFYYIRVILDPFGQKKVIVKRDGSINESQEFATKLVALDKFSFEVQDARVELEDKLYKRNIRHDPVNPKHDQDIKNLQMLLQE